MGFIMDMLEDKYNATSSGAAPLLMLCGGFAAHCNLMLNDLAHKCFERRPHDTFINLFVL